MSLPTPPGRSSAVSGTVLAVVVGAVFCFTVAGVVGLVIAAPEGANVEQTVTILLGSLASTIAALVALVKVNSVGGTVDQVARDTTALTNGLMDAKIRAAVADVLSPHLVDPEMSDRLAVDRETRDNHNRAAHGETPPAPVI